MKRKGNSKRKGGKARESIAPKIPKRIAKSKSPDDIFMFLTHVLEEPLEVYGITNPSMLLLSTCGGTTYTVTTC